MTLMVARISFEAVIALARKALGAGGEMLSPTRVAWNVAADCENPQYREVWARPTRRARAQRRALGIDAWGETLYAHGSPNMVHLNLSGGPGKQLTHLCVELEVRCRRCGNCRRHRARDWASRGRAELGAAKRSWHATLTIAPTPMARAVAKAQLICSKRGEDYEALELQDQCTRVHDALQPEITKFLKRLRKNSRDWFWHTCKNGKRKKRYIPNTEAKLRYLCVMEPHTGEWYAAQGKKRDQGSHYYKPHYHILIHEVEGNVTNDEIEDAWWLGQVRRCRVVEEDDPRPAGYVTSYLTKTMGARVRASIGYGKNDLSPPKENPTTPRTDFFAKSGPTTEQLDASCVQPGEARPIGQTGRGSCTDEHVSYGGRNAPESGGSAPAGARLSTATATADARGAPWPPDARPSSDPAAEKSLAEAAWASRTGSWDGPLAVRHLGDLPARLSGEWALAASAIHAHVNVHAGGHSLQLEQQYMRVEPDDGSIQRATDVPAAG